MLPFFRYTVPVYLSINQANIQKNWVTETRCAHTRKCTRARTRAHTHTHTHTHLSETPHLAHPVLTSYNLLSFFKHLLYIYSTLFVHLRDHIYISSFLSCTQKYNLTLHPFTLQEVILSHSQHLFHSCCYTYFSIFHSPILSIYFWMFEVLIIHSPDIFGSQSHWVCDCLLYIPINPIPDHAMHVIPKFHSTIYTKDFTSV